MSIGAVLLAGMLVLGGVVALVLALVPAPPRLQPALDRLGAVEVADVGPVEFSVNSRSERWGLALYRRTPLPLTERQLRLLRLQDKSIPEFFADKLVFAVVGALLPALITLAYGWLADSVVWWPLWLTMIGLIGGYFLPDLRLQRAGRAIQTQSVEALLVFVDLVTLERLANASAAEALQAAAELSDVPLFGQIRIALDRARLEQQSPYAQLRRLSVELQLPELKDVADIMQLDESGAALSGTLRARARELRNAHFTRQQIAAGAAAEGMTIYMTIPALLFGLIFLGAALLTLVFEA